MQSQKLSAVLFAVCESGNGSRAFETALNPHLRYQDLPGSGWRGKSADAIMLMHAHKGRLEVAVGLCLSGSA